MLLKRLIELRSDEKGQIIPMFAMLLAIILGISAIVINSGGVFHARNENYNIAEASALSTLDYLEEGSDELVKSIATEYAVRNGAKEEDVVITTKYNVLNDKNESVNEVTVKVYKEYNMIFGEFIKRANDSVYKQYTAQTPSN